MQVLTSKCPYCDSPVETTIDHLDEPIICPSCHRPFEMEIPTVQVTSVREVDDAAAEGASSHLATEPEERIVLKLHPVVFRAHPWGALIALVIFAASIIGLWMSIAAGQATIALIASGVGLVIALGMVGFWYVASRFTTLTVTDSRTIYREGIISRDTSEVQHDDVRNLQLDQSLLERLLGVGDIGISSSGQDDLEIVARGIAHPDQVIKIIRQNQA